VLVLYRREDRLLRIFDIVGPVVPPFADIYPFISDSGDQVVEFCFMPDRLRLDSPVELVADSENGTHLLGHFPLLGQPNYFPYTAHA
jgi:hypothetical protein